MKNKTVRVLIIIGLFTVYSFVKPYFNRSTYLAKLIKAQQSNILKDELQSRECKLYDDSDSIAHIKAETELQTYACWGYIQARDRAAQMDFLRRTAYGKKAEIGGYKDIKSDFFINVIGISLKAKELYTAMNLKSQKILLAYSYGVNKALLENIHLENVYEFEKLQLFPEPWSPENSLALLLLQSLEQTKDNFLIKLDEENLKKQHGTNAQTLFSKDNLPWETYIIKENDSWALQKTTKKKPETAKIEPHTPYPLNTQPIDDLRENLFPEENWGSNSWVLAPDKTESKKAWLANDPHLSLKNPPFWYWVHIESKDFSAIGANLPGIPVFASGVNSYVSWGLTNSYLPAGNLYFVAKKEIEADTKLKSIRPLIWFKLWKFNLPFFFKSYQRLNERWPLLPLDLNPELSLIFHWSSLDLDAKSFEAFFDLVNVKTAAEIDQVFTNIKLNSWNFVFADINGNIGYRATGLIHRYEQKPEFGIEVKSYENILALLAAKNYLNTDEIPHLLNPKRGYVVTANNRQWKQGVPFYLGASSNSEFRAHRIEELLTTGSAAMGLEKIKASQCDNQAQDAKVFIPLLDTYLRNSQIDKHTDEALNILKSWDLQTSINCKECFLFRRWMNLIYEGENLNVIGLYKSLTSPDLVAKESFTKTLIISLEKSYNEYLILIQANSSWGTLHINEFKHLWGDDFNSTTSIATPGDEETVNPGTANWDGHLFKQRSGASQRLIIEMTNPPKVYSTLAGENKDHDDPNLNDDNFAWSKWAKCEIKQRKFPLDWLAIKTQKIVL